MRLSAGAVLPLVVVVVLAAGVGAGVSAAAEEPADAVESTIYIGIQDNGDAVWRVSIMLEVEDDEVEAFDRLAEDYVAEETDLLPVEPYEEAASMGEAATGREMTVQNVSRDAAYQEGTGYLVVEFVWTGFAAVEDDQMMVGDAFDTDPDRWLPGLADGQRLVIEFPAEYSVVSSSRALADGAFVVEGPVSFQAGDPSAVLEYRGPRTPEPPDDGVADDRNAWAVIPVGWVGGVLGLVIVVVALVAVAARFRERALAGDGDVGVGGSGGGDGAPAEEPLLSDEERILRLLETNGGRMKQVAIVAETDWSDAKVSQLLSEMDERGQIDKLRLGRENLISLPDEAEDG